MNIMAIRTLFKVRSKTLTTTNCFLDLLLFHNCYRSRPPPQITTLLPSNTEISKLDRAKNIQSFVVHNKHTFFPEGLYYAAYAKYQHPMTIYNVSLCVRHS